MTSELKIFLGLLIVVLLTLSSMADAAETHYWIHYKGADQQYTYPLAGMYDVYTKADQEKLCQSHAWILNEHMRKSDVEYVCFPREIHNVEMKLLKAANPDWR